MMYDAYGRRENLPNGFSGSQGNVPASYLYDGAEAIQSSNASSATNYLREPGSGEMLMESQSEAGSPQVPLLDAAGSALAMVDSASGSIVSSYQ